MHMLYMPQMIKNKSMCMSNDKCNKEYKPHCHLMSWNRNAYVLSKRILSGVPHKHAYQEPGCTEINQLWHQNKMIFYPYINYACYLIFQQYNL